MRKRTKQRVLCGLWLALVSALTGKPSDGHTVGLPEPGLAMYGVVLNLSTGQTRLTSGILTWTISLPTDIPITVSTPLTDINGQYSFVAIVPFETILGNSMLSPNTLQLNNSPTTYIRTNIFLTVNGTNYPVTISAPALGTFTFGPFDRGRLEEVNLSVSIPGLSITNSTPSFNSPPRFVNGQFQLTVGGAIGQTYTLLGSIDLVTWVPLSVFACTNPSTLVYDPSTNGFTRRFYKFGQ